MRWSVLIPVLLCCLTTFIPQATLAHLPEGQTFKIFQFPDDHVPSMDGSFSDWDKVPADYFLDYILHEEKHRDGAAHDTTDHHIIRAAVGWNDRLNRLYFIAEVYDDVWRFSHPSTDSLDTPHSRMTGAHVHGNDIWEIVVDADHAGDRVINFSEEPEAEFRYRSAYTQNYHLYIPPLNGHYWHWLWGKALWTKREEFSAFGWSGDVKHLGAGRVVYECYLTPFDDLHPDGPEHSEMHDLQESAIIGLSWGFLDADDKDDTYDAFWSLNKQQKIYCSGEFLADFKLMPLESKLFD
jgi:hypothetical protein